MITLMLSDSNIHEFQVLEAVFTQYQFVVIPLNPSYQFYVKMLQYAPEIVLLEMPSLCKDQLHFVELMRKHKKLLSVPIIGFGDTINTMVFNHYRKTGLNVYISRPLKISVLIEKIEMQLHKKVLAENKEVESTQDDLSFLLDVKQLPLKKIEFMANHVSKLLAFPFTATKVISLSSNDTSGAKQLSQVINADPTISAQILKIANSVFFASLNRRINSIHDAIVRIGFNETKRIVISMAVMNLFDQKMHNAGFDRIDYWYHCIGCAIIAERIARRNSIINADEAFLSGLLHDLGILLMDEFFPSVLSHILNITTENTTDFIDEEKAAMGITHIDFTSNLFEHWKIPLNITRGITKKVNFRLLARDMVEDSQIGLCIGMAEMLSKTLFLGQECDQFVRPMENELFDIVRLPTGFTDSFVKDVYNDMLFYQQFLKLDKNEFITNHEGIKNAADLKIGVVNISKDLFVPPVLYLRKEGATVQELFTDNIEKIKDKFDILIVWCKDNCLMEDMISFTTIPRRKNDLLPSLTCTTLPVILIIKPSSPLESLEHPQINLLPQSIDMRKFDRAICEIIDGQNYNFFKIVSKNMGSVPSENA
jgi:HD-like signal output (HDOD) protein/AmiR/NasT family two-component response regulator